MTKVTKVTLFYEKYSQDGSSIESRIQILFRDAPSLSLCHPVNRPLLNRPIHNRPTFNRPTFNRPLPNRPLLNRPLLNRPTFNRPILNRPILNRPVPNKLRNLRRSCN